MPRRVRRMTGRMSTMAGIRRTLTWPRTRRVGRADGATRPDASGGGEDVRARPRSTGRSGGRQAKGRTDHPMTSLSSLPIHGHPARHRCRLVVLPLPAPHRTRYGFGPSARVRAGWGGRGRPGSGAGSSPWPRGLARRPGPAGYGRVRQRWAVVAPPPARWRARSPGRSRPSTRACAGACWRWPRRPAWARGGGPARGR